MRKLELLVLSVVLLAGCQQRTATCQEAMQAHGVTVEWIPLEQLICGYGAAHCMTQVMQRE